METEHKRTSAFAPLAALLLAVGLIIGCASGPVVIDEGLEPSELIQRAQEASDKNKTDLAIRYYQAILDRYPDDRYSNCAARYEIAFIQFKQKDYEMAKKGLEELLALYEEPDAELLPAQFKVLGEKILAKILTAAK